LRQCINSLRTVRGAQNAVSVIIKERTLLDIVSPVGHSDEVTSLTVGFNGVLIDRGIDHAQIVKDATGLRPLAGAEKARDRNRCQKRNNGDDDHNFDKGEALERLGGGRLHIYIEKSSEHANISKIDICPATPGISHPMTRVKLEDYYALDEFRHLLRKFLRFSRDFLSEAGDVTPEQYEALLAIKAFTSPEGLTISQLSQRLQIRHHSAVNIVDRLAEGKLITRETAKSDRRRRHVTLTAKGEKVLEELAIVHWKEMRARSSEIIKALERLKK